jgi:hypothetical protein
MSTNPPSGNPGSVPVDGDHPASAPQTAAPAPKSEPKTAGEALFDAIKELPYVGPWFVWLIKQFGWKGLILFASGAVIGATVVILLLVTGKLYAALVPDTYRQPLPVSSPTPSPEPWRESLPVVEINDLSTLPLLSNYYNYVLNSAGDSLKDAAVTVLRLKDTLPRQTGESKWLIDLKSDKNYEIVSGYGFRVTTYGLSGASKQEPLIQPLSNDDQPTHFRLPPCQKGDTLVAIVVYRRREHFADNERPEFQSLGQ